MKKLLTTLLIIISLSTQAQVKDTTVTDSTRFISKQNFDELDKYLRSKLTVDDYLKFAPLVNEWKLYCIELYKRRK